jgi:hypothetical protein
MPRLTYVILPNRIEDQLFSPAQRYSMCRFIPSIRHEPRGTALGRRGVDLQRQLGLSISWARPARVKITTLT